MTLKTQMAADLGAVFYNTDEFGTAGTYRASVNGADVSCTFIWEEDPQAGAGIEDIGQARQGTVRVRESEVATPQVGGIFTDSETGRKYEITTPPSLEAGEWTARAVTDRRPRA